MPGVLFLGVLGWKKSIFRVQIGMLWNKKDKNGESIEAFITFNCSHRSAVFKLILVEAVTTVFPVFLWVQSCQSMRRKEDDGDRKRREEQVHGPGLMVPITPHYTTPRHKYMKVLQKTHGTSLCQQLMVYAPLSLMDVDNELLKIEFLFQVPKTYPLLPLSEGQKN